MKTLPQYSLHIISAVLMAFGSVAAAQSSVGSSPGTEAGLTVDPATSTNCVCGDVVENKFMASPGTNLNDRIECEFDGTTYIWRYGDVTTTNGNPTYVITNCYTNVGTHLETVSVTISNRFTPKEGYHATNCPPVVETYSATATNEIIQLEITPTNAFACANCSNDCEVTFSLTNSNTDVTWEIEPSGLSDGATISSDGVVTPGSVCTSYTVTARSTGDTNCIASATLKVLCVEIIPTNTNACASCTNDCDVEFSLTNSNTEVTWEIEPSGLSDGATISSEGVVTPGSVCTSYTVTARSTEDTNCSASATLKIICVNITPTNTNACASCTNDCEVEFSLTNSNTDVTWKIEPSGVVSGASLTVVDDVAVVDPGSIGTSYIIRATSTENTNCTVTTAFKVIQIEITPTNTNACASCTNDCEVEFRLTNSNTDVTWSLEPSGVSSGASLTVTGDVAVVDPGNIGTNYIIRATSTENTNCTVTTAFKVIRVEITPTNTNACASCTNDCEVEFNLTNSNTKVSWTIKPSGVVSGATLTVSGEVATVEPGSIGTTYVVRATSTENTNCTVTTAFKVIRIEITPTNAFACASCTNKCDVQYKLTNTNTKVTWKIKPQGIPDGATLRVTNDVAIVSPGSVATNYKIFAISSNNTNCVGISSLQVYAVSFKRAPEGPIGNRYGYDEMEALPGNATNDHVSVEKNSNTFIKVLYTGDVSKIHFTSSLPLVAKAVKPVPPPTGKQGSFELEIVGGSVDKLQAEISARIGSTNGPICALIYANVYKAHRCPQLIVYSVEDPTSPGTRPVPVIASNAFATFAEKTLKQAVMKIDNVSGIQTNIVYDHNTNGILDWYYDGGSNVEFDAIKTNLPSIGAPSFRAAIVKDVAFSYRLASAAPAGTNRVTLIGNAGNYINQWTNRTFRLGSDVLTLSNVTGNVLTFTANLSTNHPAGATIYTDGGGFAADPLLVSDKYGVAARHAFLLHEFLHKFANYSDVSFAQSIMNFQQPSASSDLFYRQLKKTYNPGKENQWDTTPR